MPDEKDSSYFRAYLVKLNNHYDDLFFKTDNLRDYKEVNENYFAEGASDFVEHLSILYLSYRKHYGKFPNMNSAVKMYLRYARAVKKKIEKGCFLKDRGRIRRYNSARGKLAAIQEIAKYLKKKGHV